MIQLAGILAAASSLASCVPGVPPMGLVRGEPVMALASADLESEAVAPAFVADFAGTQHVAATTIDPVSEIPGGFSLIPGGDPQPQMPSATSDDQASREAVQSGSVEPTLVATAGAP